MARLSTQVWTGVVIVLVGLLLLLDSTGVVTDIDFSLYIPSVFVLLGVYAMVRSRFRSVVGPLIVIVVAGAWQLARLDRLPADLVDTWWPLLLVAVGLAIIWTRWRTKTPRPDAASDSVDAFGFFGGSERRVTSDNFQRGDVTVAFGGAELDLRDAELARDGAEIGVLAMFGGVEITVPRDWDVDIEVLPIFGGASDERLREDREDVGERPTLTVSGVVAFGGVTIKD